jgi:hypothetical protein
MVTYWMRVACKRTFVNAPVSFFCTAVMERYVANARFCLTANYLSKIIPALQSRFARAQQQSNAYVVAFPESFAFAHAIDAFLCSCAGRYGFCKRAAP